MNNEANGKQQACEMQCKVEANGKAVNVPSWRSEHARCVKATWNGTSESRLNQPMNTTIQIDTHTANWLVYSSKWLL